MRISFLYPVLTINLFNEHPFQGFINNTADLDMHISELVGVTSDLREIRGPPPGVRTVQ